jgi:Protein of unknown function (DUF1501)
MKSFFHHATPETRRQFVLNTAKSALGVSLLPLFSENLLRAEGGGKSNAGLPGFGKAKHVIFLWMEGGMSHIDTFDPKSGDSKGFRDHLKTKAEGLPTLGGYLPKLAENHANKLSIIRSMYSRNGVHEQAQYIMRTGYEPRSTVVHPTVGSWATNFLGRIKGVTLPDSVLVNNGNAFPGAGFLAPAMSPVPISDPESGLQNIRPTTDQKLFKERITLMNEFDEPFRKKFQDENVKAYTEFYDETLKLMDSKDLKAFDISQESPGLRSDYGQNSFGQGCLLARRLVESGVRFVEVQYGGWDMHTTIDDNMTSHGEVLDTAMSALLTDLASKGLLESTLVVVGTEFGRGHDINNNDGRDHHPQAYSTVFAGAGVKGGYAYGATDKQGRSVETKQTTPSDFIATIGHAMGLPVHQTIFSPSGRPFTMASKGAPVTEIFT